MGVYKPTYNWGAPHCMWAFLSFKFTIAKCAPWYHPPPLVPLLRVYNRSQPSDSSPSQCAHCFVVLANSWLENPKIMLGYFFGIPN